MNTPCPLCDDTGWKPIEDKGVRRVIRCEAVAVRSYPERESPGCRAYEVACYFTSMEDDDRRALRDFLSASVRETPIFGDINRALFHIAIVRDVLKDYHFRTAPWRQGNGLCAGRAFEVNEERARIGIRIVYRHDHSSSRQIGARGLRMIIEELMLDLMYTLPGQKKVRECVITREVVESKEQPITLIEKAG